MSYTYPFHNTLFRINSTDGYRESTSANTMIRIIIIFRTYVCFKKELCTCNRLRFKSLVLIPGNEENIIIPKSVLSIFRYHHAERISFKYPDR